MRKRVLCLGLRDELSYPLYDPSWAIIYLGTGLSKQEVSIIAPKTFRRTPRSLNNKEFHWSQHQRHLSQHHSTKFIWYTDSWDWGELRLQPSLAKVRWTQLESDRWSIKWAVLTASEQQKFFEEKWDRRWGQVQRIIDGSKYFDSQTHLAWPI
jgi:hypothetical protein